jgi:ferric-dicitrate binding protein FerR (iron transport regulator)
MRELRLSFGVLGLAGAIACSKPAPPSVRPAPSASATGLAGAEPASVPHLVQPKGACRALLVNGKATADGTPIIAGTLLDGEHWIELEAGSSVALRHTVTSREFKLIGPGKVLPCRGGAEQLLLTTGQLSTSANLGVRPGAEVLIATPLGTVHYGDAALDVESSAQALRVRVKQGEAWVEPEKAGKPPFKNPVGSGAEVRLSRRPINAQELLDACQTAAQHARDSAERVLTAGQTGASSSLGARAAENMRARAGARSECAMAAAALGALEDPAERQSLSAAVAHADDLWRSVPPAATGQKN